MNRAVFDTNVWVSGLIFGGEVQNVLLTAIEGKILSITSRELLQEFEGVLKSHKFNLPQEAVSAFLYEIQTLSIMAYSKLKLNVIQNDPDDNRVLEYALAGKANWIVSGDSDLLKLNKFRGIKIYSPKEFLGILEK